MNKLRYIFGSLCCLALLVSCVQQPEPRRPIEQKSGSFLNKSIEKNKALNKQEETYIENIIQMDSLNEYHRSNSGFWYYYVIKDTTSTVVPEFGDRVNFQYSLADIDGNEILSEETIGKQVYMIDQSNQELISGIRDGLKLMHEGETVTFLFPSYKAYGYYGHGDYIGPNTPLQCTLTLNSIDKSKLKTDYEEN